MTEANEPFGELLVRGAREALAYERGDIENVRITRRKVTARDAHVEPPPRYDADRIRWVRERTGMSQTVFADALNVSVSTVRAWEQGKREPAGPSLRLLEFAARYPRAFERTVCRGTRKAG